MRFTPDAKLRLIFRFCERLTNVDVWKAIAGRQATRAKRLEITADRVAQELAKIGFSSIRDIAYAEDGHVKINDTASLTEAQAAASWISRNTFKPGFVIRR